MTQGIGELIVCEYSAKQRCFHIHTLAEALEKNLRGILRGCELDYIPFAITDDFLGQIKSVMKRERKSSTLEGCSG